MQKVFGCLTARMGRGFNGQDALNPIITPFSHSESTPEAQERERASALKARDYKDATDLVVQEGVRRIMPIECCRLQGFPDIWDSVEGSDSAKFRMWGSGMALPCILYIMEGIVECEKERVKPNE